MGLSEDTREDYRHCLDHDLIPFFRGLKLSEIEPPDVRRLVARLEKCDLSRASIKKRIATLGALLATAVEDGELRYNPAREVRIGAAGRDPVKKCAMTRNQLAAVLAAAPNEWRLFLAFLAHTGLRISEAVGLRWFDVDFGRRLISVTSQVRKGKRKSPKSEHGVRQIPLSEEMARSLWKARSASNYRADTDPVFPATNGSPLRPPNIHDRVIKPAAKKAGVPWVSAHTFRHTCASLLFEGGKNPKQVQEWLGHHASGYTMDTYVHLLDGGLGSADFLDQAVQVGGNTGATQDPQTAANATPTHAAESAI